MRVTNKMLSNNFLRDMNTNINNLKKLQEQMTSGKEIRKPSDDPFKVARAMQLHTDINTNKQYNENISDNINWLDTTDTALGQAGEVLQRVRELMVSAGNAGYSASERKAIKDEINEKIGEFSQVMNTSFDGKYIFAGSRGSVKPVEVVSNKTAQVGAITKLTNTTVQGGTAAVNGSFVGAVDTLYNVKVTGITAVPTAGTVSSITCTSSTDGGVTWNPVATGPTAPPVPGSFTLGTSGLTYTIGSSINNKIAAAGTPPVLADEFTFSATAQNTMATSSAVTNTNALGAIGIISGKPLTVGTTNFQARIDSVDVAPNAGKVLGMSYSTDGGTTWIPATGDASDPITYTFANMGSVPPVDTGVKFTVPTNANNGMGDVLNFTTKVSATGGNSKLVYFSGDSTKPELAITGVSSINNNYTEYANISTKLKTEISQGVTLEYNVGANEILQFSAKQTDGTFKDYDLRELFKEITNHLDGNSDDGTVTDPTATSKVTGTDLQGITDTINNLLKIRSEVGAKQNRMESAKDKNVEQNFNMTEILSHTEDIDITEKTMEYATMQTVYMASLQTSAKVLQPTLMDYLR